MIWALIFDKMKAALKGRRFPQRCPPVAACCAETLYQDCLYAAVVTSNLDSFNWGRHNWKCNFLHNFGQPVKLHTSVVEMLCTAMYYWEYDVECDAVHDVVHASRSVISSRSHVRRRIFCMQKYVRFRCAFPETEQRNGYIKADFPQIFLHLCRDKHFLLEQPRVKPLSVSGVPLCHLVQS